MNSLQRVLDQLHSCFLLSVSELIGMHGIALLKLYGGRKVMRLSDYAQEFYWHIFCSSANLVHCEEPGLP